MIIGWKRCDYAKRSPTGYRSNTDCCYSNNNIIQSASFVSPKRRTAVAMSPLHSYDFRTASTHRCSIIQYRVRLISYFFFTPPQVSHFLRIGLCTHKRTNHTPCFACTYNNGRIICKKPICDECRRDCCALRTRVETSRVTEFYFFRLGYLKTRGTWFV